MKKMFGLFAFIIVAYSANTLAEQAPPPANSNREVAQKAPASPKVSELMFETITSEGLEAAKKRYRKLKTDGFKGFENKPDSLTFMASAYLYRFDRSDVAAVFLEWSQQLDPKLADTEWTLAWLSYLKGDREGAINHYARAQELEPSYKGQAPLIDKLKDDPAGPSEGERLAKLLGGAKKFKGSVERVPISVDSLKKKLDAYLSHVPAGETQGAGELINLYAQVLAEYQKEQRESFKAYARSPISSVAAEAARANAKNRQITAHINAVSTQFDTPLDLKFTALDGAAIDAVALRGKPAVVVFWATWSPMSRKALPDLKALFEKYRGDGVEIIGVALDFDPATASKEMRDAKRIATGPEVLSFAKENGLTWIQYYDGQGFASPVAQKYMIDGIPKILLFDRDGKLLADASSRELDLLESSIQHALATPATAPKK